MPKDLNHLLKMEQIALIGVDHGEEPAKRSESADRAAKYNRKVRNLRDDLGSHQY